MSTYASQLEIPLAPEKPRDALLICDNDLHVLHASEGSASLLSKPGSVIGESLPALLAGIAQCEGKVRAWMQASAPEIGEQPETLNIETLDDRILLCKRERMHTQYQIVSLEDQSSRTGNAQGLAAAHRDPLTGIGNRLLFQLKLEAATRMLETGHLGSATVLFLDLDRFKNVNDTLGHMVGDQLLRLVADRIVGALPPCSVLARMGGDEFAFLLTPSPSRTETAALAEFIIDLIGRAYLVEGHVIHIGASIGITEASSGATSPEQLLKEADLALYHAKSSGRGTFQFFESSLEEKAERRRSLEMDLRKALVLRQFEIHYQPQVDLDSGRITALEALLRWRHPTRGVLLPDSFIWLAEEIGLTPAIGDWVIRSVCREAAQWPQSLAVTVNVSPLHFASGDLTRSIETALQTSGLAGERLEIDLTEDIFLQQETVVSATLQSLRTLGVKLAMDNYGTGVTSFGRLVNHPFDKIKVPQSLIDVDGDPKGRAILRAIASLALTMGISTLIKGIESEQDLSNVREQGCQTVQGFYYSPAIAQGELAGLFTKFQTSSA